MLEFGCFSHRRRKPSHSFPNSSPSNGSWSAWLDRPPANSDGTSRAVIRLDHVLDRERVERILSNIVLFCQKKAPRDQQGAGIRNRQPVGW